MFLAVVSGQDINTIRSLSTVDKFVLRQCVSALQPEEKIDGALGNLNRSAATVETKDNYEQWKQLVRPNGTQGNPST